MSVSKEVDLIDKLLSAVKLFSERTTALEKKVVDEMTLLRNDIQQLKQTIATEHNTVSLPIVMEQQRMTMIELVRQFQPLLSSNQPLIPQDPVQAPIQEPVVEKPKTLIQVPVVVEESKTLIQKSVVVEKPETPVVEKPKAPIQAPVVEKPKAPVQAPAVEKPKEPVQAPVVEKPKAPIQPSIIEKPKAPIQPSVIEKPKASIQPSIIENPKTPVQAPVVESPVKFFFNAKTLAKPPTPVQSQGPNNVTFSFAKPPSTNAEPKPLFGSAADSQKPLFGGVAPKGPSSFASFANVGGNGSFLNNTGSSGGLSNADPKQFKLFGSAQNKTDDGEAAGDDTSPEEFVPDDAQFKRPDIALPDLVQAKTGEEDEQVLFSARCRLFRFLNGEAKERGTGDIKLLKSTATEKIRCVMRREQVLKVCANFVVHPGLAINTTKRGENVLTWACKDYSEDPNGEDMTLICRFKDVPAANQFKEIIQSV